MGQSLSPVMSRGNPTKRAWSSERRFLCSEKDFFGFWHYLFSPSSSTSLPPIPRGWRSRRKRHPVTNAMKRSNRSRFKTNTPLSPVRNATANWPNTSRTPKNFLKQTSNYPSAASVILPNTRPSCRSTWNRRQKSRRPRLQADLPPLISWWRRTVSPGNMTNPGPISLCWPTISW